METGLILVVPEAEPIVADLRRRLDPNALNGVPAHGTVRYPFRSLEQLDEAALARRAEICLAMPAFDLVLQRTCRFPGVLWLAPQPREPIEALTRALVHAFPDCRPYGGRHPDPQPPLTVAIQPYEPRLDRAERTLRRRLTRPLTARIESCALFARTAHGWRKQRRFPLG